MSDGFRNRAAFGKRIEYFIVGLMLKEGLDVYLPLVDDDAIDAVVKRPDGKFVEIQIKARSQDVKFGSAALFAALSHQIRPNYWFVFYSERMDTMWIMTSSEFVSASDENKKGINKGKRTIWFNGKNTKQQSEHVKPQFLKYVATSFDRIVNEDPN